MGELCVFCVQFSKGWGDQVNHKQLEMCEDKSFSFQVQIKQLFALLTSDSK